MLTHPLSEKECEKIVDKDGFITVLVAMDIEDIIDDDRETFLDHLSEKIVTSGILSDISYKLIRVINDSEVQFSVTAEPVFATE